MFWDKYVALCSSVGKAPNVVAKEIGIKSSGTVTGWKNGVTPHPARVEKIADYFGVTTDYLLYDAKKEPPRPEAEAISEERRALNEMIDSMTEAELNLLRERATKIIESRG